MNESEKTPRDSGQRILVFCGPRGCRVGDDLATER